jgi:hypothetical protein
MEDTARCRREIAAIEALIASGHRDLHGLCLALSDWCAELRLVDEEMAMRQKEPAAAEAGAGSKTGGEATC